MIEKKEIVEDDEEEEKLRKRYIYIAHFVYNNVRV